MSGTQAAPDMAADTAALEADAQAQSEFEAGHAMETEAKPPAKVEQSGEKPAKPADKPAEPAKPDAPKPPKYVRVTEEQFAKWNAAVERLATFDQQFSKVFGTLGDVQKLVKNLQAQTPQGLKVEIPKDAFAAMAKDFPELAEHTRAGLEAALKGVTGTAATARLDPDELSRTVQERIRAVQVEALVEEYPDWREIVGAPSQPNGPPNETAPFRKWLATKDPKYQAKVNNTFSAALLARAIRTFEREGQPAPQTPARPDPKAEQRRARIQEAVQPRGDGSHAPTQPSDEEQFEAGFRDR